jgi:hypothetical protein
MLEAARALMDATVFSRCQYVVEENMRVVLHAVDSSEKNATSPRLGARDVREP